MAGALRRARRTCWRPATPSHHTCRHQVEGEDQEGSARRLVRPRETLNDSVAVRRADHLSLAGRKTCGGSGSPSLVINAWT